MKDIFETEQKAERLLLVGVAVGGNEDEVTESLDELEELARTAGGVVIGRIIQNREAVHPGTYVGKGKLEEIKEFTEEYDIDTIVCDDELSPAQLKNLETALNTKVIDRTIMILDIFAMRAITSEGKIQVELAQLKYQLPRLRGMGLELSRTGGGIGTRGPGETKLESDRRHIRTRIASLEEQIREIKKHRELLRKRRHKDGQITGAIVGYTNAGKSTLLNRLTDAGVFAEDKLFATLDTTSRAITLEDNRCIILIDTVGFIRKLPHYLIEAFKSTLEEAADADFIIHVTDASTDEANNHIKVVNEVLDEIGAVGKLVINVYNKCDIENKCVPAYKGENVFISAKTGQGIGDLLEAISRTAPGIKIKRTLLIPYSDGGVLNDLHTKEKILKEEYTAEGVLIDALIDDAVYKSLKKYEAEKGQ